jgi:sortase A
VAEVTGQGVEGALPPPTPDAVVGDTAAPAPNVAEVATDDDVATAAKVEKVATAGKATKVSKWDRPPHPHDWRFWVGGLGRVLLSTGILMFGFVAYQLWGTGLETARHQRALENEFEDLLAESGTSTVPATSTTTVTTTEPEDESPTATTAPDGTAPPATVAPAVEGPVDQQIPPISEGDPLARIEIPSIGVDDIVVAGVSVADLRRGPGHFPETPLPGQLGNSAIAGHRTTYGQPFRNVDDLEPGDEIVLTTVAGRFVYDVTGSEVVSPDDYEVVLTTDPTIATITLTSCHPVWSARQRIVVYGLLDQAASDPVGFPTTYAGSAPTEVPPATSPATTATTAPATTPPSTSDEATAGTTPATTAPATTAPTTTPATLPAQSAGTGVVSEESQDAFSQGWFQDEGAFVQVALWGLALTVISIGAWMLSRRTRHDLVGFAVGIVPFAIALFFFFQNVNRLLPPSL